MSGFIQLGEHNYVLPAAPTSQDDVFFSKENKENQYWRRDRAFPKFFFDWNPDTEINSDNTWYDQDGVLLTLSRDDTRVLINLRDRELYRRIHGVWFMNNGELTYLTGGHYFILQWGAMAGYSNPYEDGRHYGQYRKFQRDYGYMLDLTRKDENCGGLFTIKPKKTGITQYCSLDMLDESTRMRGKIFGIMSKTQDKDCRDVNFMYYKYGLENMPRIMVPSIANQNLTMIFYGNPDMAKNKKNKAIDFEYLNSRVTANPTKDAAFDGPKVFRAHVDEFPKIKDTASPENVHKKTIAAVKLQKLFIGKLNITSYVPEEDDTSCEQAEKIYWESKLKTVSDRTGRTKSELYAHAISILDSVEGSFDRFGNPDRQSNMTYYMNGISDCGGDPNKIQAWKRQNMLNEDDAWIEGGANGSVFDNVRLGFRRKLIEEMHIMGNTPYVMGDLKWVGDKENSAIYFKPLEDAEIMAGKVERFRIYDHSYLDAESFNIPLRENIRDKRNKKLKPRLTGDYFAAMDPTNYVMKKMVLTGSKNAIYVMNFPNAAINSQHGKKVTDRIVLEYIYRHNKPADTIEDLIKIILYFGCYILIEGNMGAIITVLIERGYENFIMVRDKDGAIVPYDETRHQTLITSTIAGGKNVIDDYIRAASNYLAMPEDGDFDNLDNLKSLELIIDLMKFDSTDTKKFDAAVAFCFCILGMNSFMPWRVTELAKLSRKGDGSLKLAASKLLDN